MAREVLPVVKRTPVLAGVNGTDPFLILDDFLRRLRRAGLLRRAELPDGRDHRRPVPPEPGRDRHGLRPRGRDDPRRPRARSPDHALRVQRARGHRHGRGRRRHHRLPHGPDDGRQHRRGERRSSSPTACRSSTPGRRRRARSTRTSSCCATAGRSPRPRMRRSSWPSARECNGFYGASSMERLPTEQALVETTRQFKKIRR